VGLDEGPAHSLSALNLNQRAKMEILFAIMLGLFLGALDQTIVAVALPRIITDLGGQELLTWTVTIYLLTSTISVPFYGKLSDLYGRKPMLMIGITIFLIGSALSGLSQNMNELILFRGIQGLGAGALFPVSLAVIGDLFTPAERGKYQGLFGGVFGIAAIIGPLLGGFLTEHASWHWIFYINIPIGIVALFVIGRLLPNVRRPDASRNLDIAGGAVFIVAVSALLIGLTNKASYDWNTFEVGGLLLISAVVGLVFVIIEARAKEPIVPLGLWRDRTYAGSIVATFLISFGFFGAAVFLPQWFQFVYGATPTNSGLYTLALLAGLIVGSVGSGQIVSRTGKYKVLILAGLAVMAFGLWLMSHIEHDTPLPVIWAWMAVTGLGIGPTLAVFTIVVQNAVPVRALGVATSNLTFFRQIGGSVGLALLGTIFANRLASEIGPQSIAAGVPPQLVNQFAQQNSGQSATNLIQVGVDLGTQLLAQVPAQYQAIVKPVIPNLVTGIYQAFSLAVGEVFLIGAGMTVAAFVATLAIRELPLRGHASGAAGAEAAMGADYFGEMPENQGGIGDEPAAAVADH
jgi:EmrB/QacA subfamily drug resistance transporter